MQSPGSYCLPTAIQASSGKPTASLGLYSQHSGLAEEPEFKPSTAHPKRLSSP